MKIRYEQPKGKRMKKQFRDLYFWKCPDGNAYWYEYNTNTWKLLKEINGDCSFCIDCRNIKKAIRLVKNSNLPKGTIFKLSSKYVGYDITITK